MVIENWRGSQKKAVKTIGQTGSIAKLSKSNRKEIKQKYRHENEELTRCQSGEHRHERKGGTDTETQKLSVLKIKM